ncbi:hypothetical protein L9F63_006987 [Diploptera punctata]|uniref:Neurite outgrowth-associated protein n=1 Tax=Diploptera punctata TaxID=6984 RepID=A0AAD7Z9B8_DIPPU|nr:hypothetical protein L9F63_006987 [Diploptera punctata]
MYVVINSVGRLTYKPFLETLKCFSTSNVRFQPRRRDYVGRPAPNPGIQHQLNNFDVEDNSSEETYEFEDMESDFMELHEMHHMHEKDEKDRKSKIQLKMVGQKYFKPSKSPNLLTWAEKEQIHYLHSSDPEKWNINKLAESFPATEEIIKKILKSSWKPQDSTRIIKHDQMVQKNWQLLQSDKLDIDPELKKHVNKFTSRNISVHHIPDPSVEEKWRPKPKITEFGNIIDSYRHLKGEDQEKPTGVVHRSHKDLVTPKDDSYVIPNKGESYVKSGCSTLESYRKNIDIAIQKGHTPSLDARLMLKHSDTNSNQVENTESLDLAVSSSTQGLQNVEIELRNDDFPPEKIIIPKNKWKRGATFKMGDCYYDDDGTFLYRVPGMK